MAYWQGSIWQLVSFPSGSYGISQLRLFSPSIQFSFHCLVLFCPAIDSKQFLYSLTNKSNTWQKDFPHHTDQA